MTTLPRSADGRRVSFVALLGLVGTVVGLALLYVVAVRTTRGQWWDQVVWWRLHQLSPYDHHEVGAALRATITPLRCLAAAAVIGALAWAQRRGAHALVGAGCAAGTFVSIEVLKHTLARPDLGVPSYALNSFPSGHTGAVAGLAVLAAVALARTRRVLVTALAVLATLATGTGVVLAGWHRPSDPVASVLVAVGWTMLGLAAGPWLDRRSVRR